MIKVNIQKNAPNLTFSPLSLSRVLFFCCCYSLYMIDTLNSQIWQSLCATLITYFTSNCLFNSILVNQKIKIKMRTVLMLFGLYLWIVEQLDKLYLHHRDNTNKPSLFNGSFYLHFFLCSVHIKFYNLLLIVCINCFNICVSFFILFRSLSSRTISRSIPKKCNSGRRTKCNIAMSNKQPSVLLSVSNKMNKKKNNNTQLLCGLICQKCVYKQKEVK